MEVVYIKKPRITGVYGLYEACLAFNLVEVAGIEPASASPLPSVLHV